MRTFELETFQNDNGGLGNNGRCFSQFSGILPRYSAGFYDSSGLSLHGNPILSPDLNFSSNFTSIIVV